MSLGRWYLKVPFLTRKLVLYYILYCFGFLLIHLSLVSTFSFFHFLLDHDMNTIENWLNRNAWEILFFSKITSFVIVSKIIKLNVYKNVRVRDILSLNTYFPSKRVFGATLFLLVIFYAFIHQFGGGIVENPFKEDLFYSSFIGSFMFYIIDYCLLFFLMNVFEISKEQFSRVMYSCLIIFVITSKIALPYLNKFYLFLMIHFIMMFYLGRKGELVDVIFYGLLVISPLSSVYGLDIVWDNAYSVYTYQKQLPILGVVGIWGIAIGYLHFSKVD